MASVSSANSTPSSVLTPGASAAHTRARLVMLFDPGTTTSASTGLAERLDRQRVREVVEVHPIGLIRRGGASAGSRGP